MLAPVTSLPRPTHFVALRIGEETRNAIAEFVSQWSAAELSESDQKWLIDPVKYHFTGFVFNILNENGVDYTDLFVEAFGEAVRSALLHSCAPFELRLRGTGTFDRGRVAYIDAARDENYAKIVALFEHVRSAMRRRVHSALQLRRSANKAVASEEEEKEEILRANEKAEGEEEGTIDVEHLSHFSEANQVLHLTVLKYERAKDRRRPRQRARAAFSEQRTAAASFGTHRFDALLLLAMREKDESGFYRCIAEVPLRF